LTSPPAPQLDAPIHAYACGGVNLGFKDFQSARSASEIDLNWIVTSRSPGAAEEEEEEDDEGAACTFKVATCLPRSAKKTAL
jgi:hypothetical protein